MQANIVRVSVRDFFVTCFTGKFGWVPYSNLLHKDAHKIVNNDVLDYSDLSKKFCLFNVEVRYVFDNQTILNLMRDVTLF